LVLSFSAKVNAVIADAGLRLATVQKLNRAGNWMVRGAPVWLATPIAVPVVIAVHGLDRAALGGDGDDLRTAPTFQLEAPEIELAAGVEDVVAALDVSEPGELDLDGVGSGID
jgi:hypothetical protein